MNADQTSCLHLLRVFVEFVKNSSIRVPEATHRELPNGKGFLRVIDGGKGKGNDAPKVPPTPPQPVRYAAAVVEDYEKHWQDMDAKLWKQREKRMDFFGDDESDNNPNW